MKSAEPLRIQHKNTGFSRTQLGLTAWNNVRGYVNEILPRMYEVYDIKSTRVFVTILYAITQPK